MQNGNFDEEIFDFNKAQPDLPEIDQLRKDELYDLKPEGSGQIRIMLQWIYSKVKLLNDILLALRYQIHSDRHFKAVKEEMLEDMQKPFGGFLKASLANQALAGGDLQLVDAFTRFGTVSEREKEVAKDVETYLKKRGLRVPKWAKATFVMTLIFLVITLLVNFYKADFLNLTVCTVAIYLLSNAKDVQPRQFRYLVAGTILSLVYDVLWLLLRSGELAGDVEPAFGRDLFTGFRDEADGGRAELQSEGRHRGGAGHLEVEADAGNRRDRMDVGVLDVAAIFAQVESDAIGTAREGFTREGYDIGFRMWRHVYTAVAGLAERRGVVDIDAEEDGTGGGHFFILSRIFWIFSDSSRSLRARSVSSHLSKYPWIRSSSPARALRRKTSAPAVPPSLRR